MHVLDSYMGVCMGQWGGYVSMYGLCNRSGFVVWGMIHTAITLPEHHEHYPHLWQSECGVYRIIRCCDGIQYIFQEWRSPKWRHLSFHIEYGSLVRRWGGLAELPSKSGKLVSAPTVDHRTVRHDRVAEGYARHSGIS